MVGDNILGHSMEFEDIVHEKLSHFGCFKWVLVMQVDISGHPPFPTSSKQFFGNFGNLLFLAGFNFRGHFEGLNEGFLRLSMIIKALLSP